ncbi:MAG: hypothetical protein ACLT76_10410 [Clostridium fessum]
MIVYLVCYAASLLLALGRHYLLSGAGLLAAAVYLYASDYIRVEIFCICGGFSLFPL